MLTWIFSIVGAAPGRRWLAKPVLLAAVVALLSAIPVRAHEIGTTRVAVLSGRTGATRSKS